MKKKLFKAAAILLPVFIILSVYILTPQSIVLTENARYSAYPNGFVRLDTDSINTYAPGTSKTRARLFGAIPLKSVQVSVIPAQNVCASGEAIGIRLYSSGIMIIDTEGSGAARAAGLRSGELITEINGTAAQSSEQLAEAIVGGAEVTLGIKDGKVTREVTLRGRKEADGFKIGMWVRDSAAGIGTMTFFDPQTAAFGALGHPVCDSDTGKTVPVRDGSISDCSIYSVKKGVAGEPGELIGSIGKSPLGTVTKNNDFGLYGTLTKETEGELVPCATRFLIKEGAAQLLCDIGNGTERFDCEIEEVSKLRTRGNKSLVIKITDERLLAATGGIVQGMSGAPILQSGRLVGAVTHVFVGDPTRGYGIFIENMLAEARSTAD